MAKLVDFECPRCGVQSQIPVGLRDVDTGQILGMWCPNCGLDFEFEAYPATAEFVK
jgi:transcription elongation factor Elf1